MSTTIKSLILISSIFLIFFMEQSTAQVGSWSDFNIGLEGGNIQAIAIDPDKPDRIYVGTLGGGFYYSEDGGNSWHRKNDSLECWEIFSLLVKKEEGQNVIYAGTMNGLYLLKDLNSSWKPGPGFLENQSINLLSKPISDSSTFIYAGFGNKDPQEASSGFLLIINKIGENFDYEIPKCEHFHSPNVYDLLPTDDPYKFDVATDSGYFKFSDLENCSRVGTMMDHQVSALARRPYRINTPLEKCDSLIFAGTEEGGRYSTNDGWYWPGDKTFRFMENNMITVFAPQLWKDSTRCYAGTIDSGIFIHFSNHPQDWYRAPNKKLPNLPVQDLVLHGNNINQLFAGNSLGIYYSYDKADNFVSKNSGSLHAHRIHDIILIYNKIKDAQELIAATDGTLFYRELNRGEIDWSNDENLYSQISTISYDSSNNYLYVGTEGNYVYRKMIETSPWQQFTNGLSDSNITVLYVNPVNSNQVYLGTEEKGLFKSLDYGHNWVPLERTFEGLDTAYVTDIVLDYTRNTIFASTLESGVYKVNLDNTKNYNSWSKSHAYSLLYHELTDSLFCGTREGLYYCYNITDFLWKKYKPLGHIRNVHKIRIIPTHPPFQGILYALTTDETTKSSQIYRKVLGSGSDYDSTRKTIEFDDIQIGESFCVDTQKPNTVYMGTSGTGAYKYEFPSEFSVEIIPQSVDFGDVHKDNFADTIITIRNKNLLMPFIISDSLNNSNDFQSSLSDSILYPGIAENCTIRINPKLSKDFRDTLFLKFKDIFIHPQLDTLIKISLTGRGCEGILNAFPNPIDFGNVPQFTERVENLFLENKGNIPIIVDTIKLVTEDGIFRLIDSAPPPIVIQSSIKLFFKVGFRPWLKDCMYKNSLIILYRDSMQNQNQDTLVNLIGTGVLNPIKPTPPDTVNFNDIHIKHLPSEPESLKIENVCDYLNVWIDNLIHHNKIFSVDTSDIPKELSGEESISINISVDATSKIGLYLDTLSIYFHYDSIVGNPDVILRTNIVSGVPKVEPLKLITDRKTHVNYDFYDSTDIELHNNGNLLLHYRIDNIRLPFFLVSSDTGSIPNNDFVKIKIKFCPEDIRPDTCVMKINFWDLKDMSGMQATINDSLIGTGADAILQFIEDITYCKDTHTKDTTSSFIKLTNVGNIPVLIDTAEFDNSAFSIVTFPDTINPDSVDSIQVNFSPHGPCQYLSTLTIKYSDIFLQKIDTSKFNSCYISGLGIGSKLEVYDSTESNKIEILDFDHVHWGDDSADATVLLKNSGNLDLNLNEPKFPPGFSQVNNINYPYSLKAGDPILLTLRFIPYKVNRHIDSVHFVYSDSFNEKSYTDSTVLNLSGFGDGAWLEASKLDTPKALVKTNDTSFIKLTNIGNYDCKIDSILFDSSFFKCDSVLLNDSLLAENESCSIRIIFSAKHLKKDSSNCKIKFHEKDTKYQTQRTIHLQLTGVGIDTIPPIITNVIIPEPTLNTPFYVQAKVYDEHSGLRHDLTMIWIRKGGEIDFSPSIFNQMSNSDSIFQCKIAEEWVTSRGVEFYFTAIDNADCSSHVPNHSRFSYFSPPIRIPELKVIGPEEDGRVVPLNTGHDSTAYQLISIPVNIDSTNRSVLTILKTSFNFAKYDEYYWRCADYHYFPEQDTSYYIYLNDKRFSEFEPCISFFLILHKGFGNKYISCPTSYTNISNMIYTIPLIKNWNLIANPFNFPIPLKNLKLSKSGKIESILTYQRGWIDEKVQINPWTGYAICCTEEPESLLINPDLRQSFLDELHIEKEDAPEYQWNISIATSCQKVHDNNNWVAVSQKASIHYDRYDQPEPPPIGDYIMLTFPHPEWKKACDYFSVDVQPPNSKGNFWNFSVYTNIQNSDVKLNFKNLKLVPENFQIMLICEHLDYIQDLRNNNQFVYNSTTANESYKFRLVVGDPEFVRENKLNVDLLPKDFKLIGNFPNPFNGSTTISYELPDEDAITIYVYNILGELISTLKKDENHAAGKYFAVWDGTNKSGKPAGSGIYLCKFISKYQSKTFKMLLIR